MPFDAYRGIDLADNFICPWSAAHDSSFSEVNFGSGLRLRVNQLSRDVAAANILAQGVADRRCYVCRKLAHRV